MDDIIERAAAPSIAKAPGMEMNRRLAAALGWVGITEMGGYLTGTPPAGHSQTWVPDWVGDWRDCGPLQSQFVRRMRLWPHRALIGVTPGGPAEHDLMRDQVDEEGVDSMLRHAIVAAVIAHLEASR